MESTPMTPRQRNRRADRQASEAHNAAPLQAASAQPTTPMQMTAPAQPAAPVQTGYRQPYAAQPQQPNAYPQRPYTQPSYQQSPLTMYQQQSQSYSAPARPPAAPTAQPSQSPPRPRVLNQAGTVSSGWQQPTLSPRTEAPRARADSSLAHETARMTKPAAQGKKSKRQEANQPTEAKSSPKKLPVWLTWGTTLSFLLVLGLAAIYWLMQAYLVTQENERIAAYQRVLGNHHITEQADGSLTVTWQEHIEKYAAQYNLQPAFVMAIIRNESSFRTNAESNVGARGLMQLMPDTAEWIASKLDDDSYTFDRMWDAETNIRYGCWYLGYLTRLFHGDAELVSAAYHTGQTTITQWLSDRDRSSDGVSLDLDRLPDGPTKQYIGRVTQTYGIYQSLLYPDKAFGVVPAGSDADPAQLR